VKLAFVFLSYFNLRSLSELPELIHERQFEDIAKEMNMEIPFGQQEMDEKSVEVDESHMAEVIPINPTANEASEDEIDALDADHQSDLPQE